jgi:hypothetical protein
MKLWYEYGSEHSMKLVMIGRFKDAASAAKAKQIIERITGQVEIEMGAGSMKLGERMDHFSEDMLGLLRDLDFVSIGPSELEQFAYDVSVEWDEKEAVIKTDEIDVSAFMKVLVDNGAKVEVFSAHEYPST